MTDDEIDAVMRTLCNLPSFREVTAARTVERDRAIFRAGMRRAARVARNTAGEFFAASNVERSIGADIAAATIERAAGGAG